MKVETASKYAADLYFDFVYKAFCAKIPTNDYYTGQKDGLIIIVNPGSL